MKQTALWIFAITGFIADIFSVLDHVSGIASAWFPKWSFPFSLQAEPVLSLLVLEYGLIGVGAFIWRILERAATVQQAWRLFLYPHVLMANLLLVLYFLAFDKRVFSLEYLLWLSLSVIATAVIGRGICEFSSL